MKLLQNLQYMAITATSHTRQIRPLLLHTDERTGGNIHFIISICIH